MTAGATGGFVFPVQRPREGAQVTKPRGVRVGDVSGPLSATVLRLGGRRTGMGNVGRYVRYVGVINLQALTALGIRTPERCPADHDGGLVTPRRGAFGLDGFGAPRTGRVLVGLPSSGASELKEEP